MGWSQKAMLVRFRLVFFFKVLKCHSVIYNSINNIEIAILVWFLVILSEDVEMNPGPESLREHCTNNFIPDFISDIIPPLVREVSNYCDNLRLTKLHTHTEISHRSCIPSSVSYWNGIQSDIREFDTFLSFRKTLKDTYKVPSFILKGERKSSIIHARIRNNCSDLKCDLFQNHLTDDTGCACGIDENALYFFFECGNYNNLRLVKLLYFIKKRKYHPLSLNTLLYGKSTLSDDDNFLLFLAVQQQYIKNTRRFQ